MSFKLNCTNGTKSHKTSHVCIGLVWFGFPVSEVFKKYSLFRFRKLACCHFTFSKLYFKECVLKKGSWREFGETNEENRWSKTFKDKFCEKSDNLILVTLILLGNFKKVWGEGGIIPTLPEPDRVKLSWNWGNSYGIDLFYI